MERVPSGEARMRRADLARDLGDLRIHDALRRDDWRFLCDRDFEALLIAWGVDRDRITSHARLSEGAPDCEIGHRFIVCTEARDAESQKLLKDHNFSSLGLFSQMVPRLAAGLPAKYVPKGGRAAELEYAILCLGRCGSTLVCRELAAADCGRPIEHVRQPVRALLRNREVARFDFSRWWDLVRAGHTINGVFATKLLHGDWRYAEPFLTDAERNMILDFLVRVPIVHIERTDKAAQAVSDFMASNTGVWHLWKDVSRQDYEARSRAIEPDLGRMVRAYLELTADEAALKSMIDGLGGAAITIDFDALVADPKGTIASVVTALGRDVPEGYSRMPLALQATTSDVHLMLRDRLLEELERLIKSVIRLPAGSVAAVRAMATAPRFAALES